MSETKRKRDRVRSWPPSAQERPSPGRPTRQRRWGAEAAPTHQIGTLQRRRDPKSPQRTDLQMVLLGKNPRVTVESCMEQCQNFKSRHHLLLTKGSHGTAGPWPCRDLATVLSRRTWTLTIMLLLTALLAHSTQVWLTQRQCLGWQDVLLPHRCKSLVSTARTRADLRPAHTLCPHKSSRPGAAWR